ncbi:VOC family protein [Sinomicrobium sp.]
MKAVQFRIARPTNKLTEVVKFYQRGLGLEMLGKFEGHSGYDGVMLGMPDKTYHLEFTQHMDKAPLPEPTKENLIVFYYDSSEEYRRANERMQRIGITPVEPENPYWIGKSQTYEDPDGWRIVLFNGVYEP